MTYNFSNCKSVLTFDGKPWLNQCKLPNIYVVDNQVYFCKGTEKSDERPEVLVVSLDVFQSFFAKFQQGLFNNLIPEEIQHINFINRNFNKFFNEFCSIEPIGKGGFGRVFKAKSVIDLYHYAVKRVIVDCSKVQKNGFQDTLMEFRILAKLNHGNIVRYHTAWFEKLDEDEVECISNQMNRISQAQSTYSHGTVSEDFSSLPLAISNSLSNIVSQSSSCNVQTDVSNSESAQQSDDQIVFGTQSLSDQALSHNGVVDIIKSQLPKNRMPKFALYIQMELCELNLRDWLSARNIRLGNSKLHEEDRSMARLLARQLLKGIEYLHSNSVIHRDIKPANIFLINHSGARGQNILQLKIGDFGLAKSLEQDIADDAVANNFELTANVGTAFYSAPEVSHIKQKKIPYDHKSDLYSMGIILLEMMLKFQTQSELVRVVSDLCRGTMFSDLIESWPTEALHIADLLSVDPQVRPEAYFILNHTTCFKTGDDGTIKDLKSEISNLKREKESLLKEMESLRQSLQKQI